MDTFCGREASQPNVFASRSSGGQRDSGFSFCAAPHSRLRHQHGGPGCAAARVSASRFVSRLCWHRVGARFPGTPRPGFAARRDVRFQGAGEAGHRDPAHPVRGHGAGPDRADARRRRGRGRRQGHRQRRHRRRPADAVGLPEKSVARCTDSAPGIFGRSSGAAPRSSITSSNTTGCRPSSSRISSSTVISVFARGSSTADGTATPSWWRDRERGGRCRSP